MKKYFIEYKIFILLLLLNSISRQVDCQIISKSGTLIIITPTKKGLIIAADKRVTYGQIETDTVNKIEIINNFLGFSTTGNPGFLESKTLKVLYDASTITKTFFKTDQTFNLETATLEKLSYALLSKFEDFLKGVEYNSWPSSGNSPNNALFLVILYGFNIEKQKFECCCLKFYYTKQNPPTLKIHLIRYTDNDLNISKPLIFGNTSVYEELRDGEDSRFNDLRKNKFVRKFILNNESLPLLSKKEIMNFSKFFITKCSNLTSLIDSSSNKIGETVDLIIIDKIKGIYWIEKNTKY